MDTSRKRCLSPSLQVCSDEGEKKSRLESLEKIPYDHIHFRSKKSNYNIFENNPYCYRCFLCNIYLRTPESCWDHRDSLLHQERFKRNPNSIQFGLCFNWELATTNIIPTEPLTCQPKMAKKPATDPVESNLGNCTQLSKTSNVTTSSTDSLKTDPITSTGDFVLEPTAGEPPAAARTNDLKRITGQVAGPRVRFQAVLSFECRLCGYTVEKFSPFTKHLKSKSHKELLQNGASSDDFPELLHISASTWAPANGRRLVLWYCRNRNFMSHFIKEVTLYCPSCQVDVKVSCNSVKYHFTSNHHKSSLTGEMKDYIVIKRLWTSVS